MQLQNKFLAIAKQLYASVNESPAVYVGTYKKYNNGDLTGMWVDLTEFNNYKQFQNWCVKQLHSDEKDPQLMFQDFQNFPRKYYGESTLDEQLWDYIEKIKEYDKDIVDAIIDYGLQLNDVEKSFFYDDCNDMKDVAQQQIEEFGGVEKLDRKTLEQYFDYQHYGREMSFSNTFIRHKNGYIKIFN